jgi:hypothetical protein
VRTRTGGDSLSDQVSFSCKILFDMSLRENDIREERTSCNGLLGRVEWRLEGAITVERGLLAGDEIPTVGTTGSCFSPSVPAGTRATGSPLGAATGGTMLPTKRCCIHGFGTEKFDRRGHCQRSEPTDLSGASRDSAVRYRRGPAPQPTVPRWCDR